MQFGFTSWNNNNGSPYADYLHLRSYSDNSGGSDNLVMFLKSGIGMRIWQQSFGSSSAYSSYKDIAFTDGTNASGTWGINVTGTAGSAPNASNLNVSYGVTAGNGNGLKFWNGSDLYKIHMGTGAEYSYGPVTDYSIKCNMDSNGSTRGFTWGQNGVAPIAAINSTSGNMRIAGSFVAGSITNSATAGRIDASNDIVAYSTSDRRLKDKWG
jgi:hypothetical protein